MLNEAELNIIIEAIENEKCILLLGPELNNLDDGLSKEKVLADYLEQQGIKQHFYEKDGLFLFGDHRNEPMLRYNLKQFYSNEDVPPIYEKIAKIPFNLLISITPDLFLQKTFDKLKFNYSKSVYDKSMNPVDVAKPNKETPLLYYLFGVYDKRDSLVLTHDDLFDFIYAILHKNELPIELKNLIQDAENLIFLGFRFDRWYVQILLHLLSDKVKKTYSKFTIGISKTTNLETKTFFIDEFEMTFVEDSIPKFIDQLYNECEKRNELRNQQTDELLSIKILEECVSKGDIDEAFKCLKKFLDKNIPGNVKLNLNEQIIQLSGRYENLKRDQIKGIISTDNYTLDICRIMDSILQIINEIKNLPDIL